MLDFRKLQVFTLVMEQRSFSKAAELCYLTQPTVSGHIKLLEEHFDLTLFDRHTREVVPTPAGTLLYRYAKRIVRLVEEMEREMASYKGGRKGKLRLGGSTIPGQYILPFLLRDFNAKFPDVRVAVQIADTRVIAEMVAEGELEAAIIGAKVLESNLVHEPCYEDEIILVIRKDFKIPKINLEKGFLEPEELKYLPLIVREKGSGTWLTTKKALRAIGASPERLNTVAELGSTEAVRQAVKAGLGAAFISRRAVQEELEENILVDIPVEGLSIKRNFYLVYPSRKTLSPTAQMFVNFVKESK